MPVRSLSMALMALSLLWAGAAWAQRTSSMEEKLEFNWDSARGDDLNPAKSATPQQCRDMCLADNRCRYWNWSEPGANGKTDPKYHSNCVLLKTTTGASRGKDFGYRYVGGLISDAPAAKSPAPTAQRGCRQDVKTWSDGTRMEGTMCDGKLHGQGSYRDPSGQRYEGEWRNGVIAGKGIAHFPNGAVYDGQWENGKPHGYGTYSNASGVFSGNWNNGCAFISGQKLWVAAERHECGF